MPRPRLYPNAAAKQKAYRQRLHEAGGEGKPKASLKPKSRPVRLTAVEQELRQLAEEYQNWLDALPGNLAGSTLAEQLHEVVAQLESIADEVDAIDPPRGFGR